MNGEMGKKKVVRRPPGRSEAPARRESILKCTLWGEHIIERGGDNSSPGRTGGGELPVTAA